MNATTQRWRTRLIKWWESGAPLRPRVAREVLVRRYLAGYDDGWAARNRLAIAVDAICSPRPVKKITAKRKRRKAS